MLEEDTRPLSERKKNYSKKSMSIKMSASIPLVSKLHTGDIGMPQRDATQAVGWCCNWGTVSLGSPLLFQQALS